MVRVDGKGGRESAQEAGDTDQRRSLHSQREAFSVEDMAAEIM